MKNSTEMMQLLDRIERLEEEKSKLGADITEVWKEAKDKGFDVKIMRKAHAIRKMAAYERNILELYIDELGLFGDATPNEDEAGLLG